MCGRFTLRTPLTVLSQQFLFELGPAVELASVRPRYNIAPTQTIAAVRRLEGSSHRTLAWFHWGLIPSWAKDAKLAASMINARGETIAEKPAFRSRLCPPQVFGAGRRLLRVEKGRQAKTAVLFSAARRETVRVRRPVGKLAGPGRQRRPAAGILYDRHDLGQRVVPPTARANASHPRSVRLRPLA